MKPYMSLFLDTPRAVQTAGEPSTMLLAQGGCPACSLSHPFSESHSSTTVASVDWPFPLIRIWRPQRLPPLYHPVESATTCLLLEWYRPSHSDGPPPSPPASKLLTVSLALVPLDKTLGEHDTFWHVPRSQHEPVFWFVEGHVFCPPPPPPPLPWQVVVPMSGSSLHLPLMQMSCPAQSLRLLQLPPQLFCATAPRSVDNVNTSAAASNITSTHACWTIFRLEPRFT